MSPANRDRARVLGVFHGGVDLDVLRMMMQWEKADVGALAVELIATGLATPNRYNHLTLNPALCPYLRGRMDSTEREALTARWVEAMREYAGFLDAAAEPERRSRGDADGAGAAEPLCAARPRAAAGDAEATIGLATSLYSLLQMLGKPRLLERVGQVRDAAARTERRWATPGITRGSRRRGPASSSSLPAGGCARRSRARSSCSSAPGRRAGRRIPTPITIWRWLASSWPAC